LVGSLAGWLVRLLVICRSVGLSVRHSVNQSVSYLDDVRVDGNAIHSVIIFDEGSDDYRVYLVKTATNGLNCNVTILFCYLGN
jgi:hypothetical protein